MRVQLRFFFCDFDRVALAVAGLLLWTSTSLQAQAVVTGDVGTRVQALEERIRALEAEVQALKAAREAAPAAAPAPARAPQPSVPPTAVQAPTGAPGTPAGPLPVYGGASALAKVLNPDMSIIGDFIGSVGRNAVNPVPVLQMHESEAGFQAIVDPYARADFFLSFGEEGVNLEEGFLTFTALPAGFVAKVGKMRASFGKVNTLHNHVLPWIDRPIVTDNLVGCEDGINDAGLSVTRILPLKSLFLEATGQVFRGDSADVFTSGKRSDASVLGYLRGYKDLSESTNLDLGLSYARGHNDLGTQFITQLYGLDATVRWKPLRRAIYHSFLARSEFIWSRREQPTETLRAFGFYTSADYRLNRRWTLGGRYDWSDKMVCSGPAGVLAACSSGTVRSLAGNDAGFSALVTYWPSEFSQVRGQYRFARYAERSDSNELRFQFLFSLGAHGAHPF